MGDSMELLGALIPGIMWALGLLVLYWVIRLGVAGGIRDASRKTPRD